jgi:hypothetical protein
MIQKIFDETITLIRGREDAFAFLDRLLEIYISSVVLFSFFRTPSAGNTREMVLDSYALQTEYGHKRHVTRYGYALNKLRATEYQYVCVSIFVTEIGTFTIFSDFDRVDMIAALFSQKAPSKVPFYSHLFLNGELLSRERG